MVTLSTLNSQLSTSLLAHPRRSVALWLLCASVASAVPVAAVESGPQGVVRQFCQADGLGLRVSPWGWSNVAPLVSWQLEPAWDEVVLITDYQVGPPHPVEGGALAIDVAF